MVNVIYANARAKSLENSLIDRERLNRMAEEENAAAALKVLTEVNFGDGTAIDSPADFEKLLTAETKKLYGFIKENCPVKAFSDFLFLKGDFFNAEAFIKAKYLKIDPALMVDEFSLIDAAEMKEKIFADDYDGFYPALKTALICSDNDFVSNSATGAVIDGYFVKAYFETLYKIAKKDSILYEIYKTKADCANVSLALRSRSKQLVTDNFVKGGDVSLSQAALLAEESFDTLKRTDFGKKTDLISSAIYACEKGEPLSDFERKCDEFAITYLNKDKYDSSGAKPFIRYCYYKKAEIENVRIIMVGKINGIKAEDIKRRLRNGYER